MSKHITVTIYHDGRRKSEAFRNPRAAWGWLWRMMRKLRSVDPVHGLCYSISWCDYQSPTGRGVLYRLDQRYGL